jgi:hypothetical protein
MTALGERNPQLRQTTLTASTALALLALSDVPTILVFPGLEQLFAIMRIAGYVALTIGCIIICARAFLIFILQSHSLVNLELGKPNPNSVLGAVRSIRLDGR